MKRLSKLHQTIAAQLANNFGHSMRDMAKCGDHRSRKATFVEMGIQLSEFKKNLADPERFAKVMKQAEQDNAAEFTLPAVKFTVAVREMSQAPMPTYVLNEQDHMQSTVIYLPGGAFFAQPMKEQWEYANQLAEQTGARVYVAVYPMLPQHNFKAAYQALSQLYQRIYAHTPASDITILGDSAGGNLATGFCEYLAAKQQPQPGKLILISPWLDLDLTNPTIAKYEAGDVTLSVVGLRRVAKLWAGETDHADYRLSPINGDLSSFRQVMVIAGTREIMYPDCARFVRELRKNKIPVQFEVGRDLFHIYPIYPIPESSAIMEKVKQFLR